MTILKTEDTAPLFNAETVYGETFSLQDELSKGSNIMLAFHRYASCPICNFSLRQFQTAYDDLYEQGLRYIPVFHSSIESMREAYPEQPPFTIISDPEMKLYKLYGLKPSISAFLHPKALADGFKAINSMVQPGYRFKFAPEKTILTKPADFIISPDRKLKHVRYGVSLGDSMSLQEALTLA